MLLDIFGVLASRASSTDIFAYCGAILALSLHRDLKSLNILVDENWRGKVADFVCRSSTSELRCCL